VMVVKLMTCYVPKDPASPVPTERYVAALTVFYEQVFGVPSHRFLHSLLQHYGLELHNQTPSTTYPLGWRQSPLTCH
jgi:hypothetical protein